MFDRLAELREKRENGEGGFTLIELLVVVVIIGILIAIAVPLYLNYRKGANDKAAQSDLRGAVSQLEQCNSDNSVYPSAYTAASGNTAASFTTGTGQTCAIPKLSDGTTFTYKASTGATGTPAANTAYIAWATNTNGGGKTYCYASAAGGSVKSGAAAGADYANACS